MLSSDGSEFDVFFDSPDCFSIDERTKAEEELGIGDFNYRVWLHEPLSVETRREKFLEKMGLNEFTPKNKIDDGSLNVMGLERISDFDYVSSSLASSVHGAEEDIHFFGRERICGSNFMSDEELYHKKVKEQNLTRKDENSGVPPSSQACEQCEAQACLQECQIFSKKKKTKRWLLKRLLCTEEGKKGNLRFEVLKPNPKVSRVKVQQNKKNHQELSAVYKVQELAGHKGFIWAMKFSPDGKYLASGGEDGVVRIWRVTLADAPRPPSTDKMDSSFKDGKSSFSTKKLNPVLVLRPEKVFHMEETPVQELYGHGGDVLNLAWSNKNYLLSASKDKTVRLWQAGSGQCLNVFHHNNYVTCIQFNPTNEDYFISGSIDGKARIWGLSEERVVAWADVRNAISAICYQPDGKGFVVGSITGTCRFYETLENDVQMEAQINVQGRKKTSGNKITGIQFCPEEHKRVMITSDDSKLRIYDGVNIVRKFKGLRKSGSQMSASFTSSSKHIISVGEDSRVYVWNYDRPNATPPKHPKSSRSCEHFFSQGNSVAVPWPGTAFSKKGGGDLQSLGHFRNFEHLSRSFRVSATWPEEKLPSWDWTVAGEGKSRSTPEDCRFSHQNRKGYSDPSDISALSEAWGLVIVTAGWDGMIRTFHNYGLPLWL